MGTKAVKKALIDQDRSIASLARQTGFTPPYLSKVINGHHDSLRAKKIIALALGKEFSDLWGDEDDQVKHNRMTQL